MDADGHVVPARVDHIGDYTWGLFPHQVFLKRGATYTAQVAASICDFNQNCTTAPLAWSFTVTTTPGGGTGDTSIPSGGRQRPSLTGRFLRNLGYGPTSVWLSLVVSLGAASMAGVAGWYWQWRVSRWDSK
jgi:hypothetical protein